MFLHCCVPTRHLSTQVNGSLRDRGGISPGQIIALSNNPFTHQACDFSSASTPIPLHCTLRVLVGWLTSHTRGQLSVNHTKVGVHFIGNDPSAGSPTDTLLRLLLPLNNQVWRSSVNPQTLRPLGLPPKASLNHSIGSSDGRCVQRAGT